MSETNDIHAPAGGPQAFPSRDADWPAAIERHRRELHVYCYRMSGSLLEAEDLVQETLLRAWRSRASFAGRSSLRSWLYRIATNVCLDALAGRPRRTLPFDAVAATNPHRDMAPHAGEGPWVEPYPGAAMGRGGEPDNDPESAVLERETLELAFIAGLAHLPAKQRAVVILRDLAAWPAGEVAEVLEDSVAAVKSALQRGRATLRERLPRSRTDWAATREPSARERALVARYIRAIERRDRDELTAVLRADLRAAWTPAGLWTDSRDHFIEGTDAHAPAGVYRAVETRANGRPAVGIYLRVPGDQRFRRLALELLVLEDGAISEIIDFSDPPLLDAFGLPPVL